MTNILDNIMQNSKNDDNDIEPDSFTCPVCLDVFSAVVYQDALKKNSKLLWMTYCKHMLCCKCVGDLVNKKHYSCPICRGKMIENFEITCRKTLTTSPFTPRKSNILNCIQTTNPKSNVILVHQNGVIVIEKD
jgi:hypothetical protein